eukprot:3159866-Pyramimonas_sp.AAC.1
MAPKKKRQAFDGSPDGLVEPLSTAFSDGPVILKYRTNVTSGQKDTSVLVKSLDLLCSFPSNVPQSVMKKALVQICKDNEKTWKLVGHAADEWCTDTSKKLRAMRRDVAQQLIKCRDISKDDWPDWIEGFAEKLGATDEDEAEDDGEDAPAEEDDAQTDISKFQIVWDPELEVFWLAQSIYPSVLFPSVGLPIGIPLSRRRRRRRRRRRSTSARLLLARTRRLASKRCLRHPGLSGSRTMSKRSCSG